MVKMEIIKFLIVDVDDMELLRGPHIKSYCRHRYPNHRKGCPNSLGPGKSCKTEMIDEIADPPWTFICAVCNFEGYREEMKKLHPGWSGRQLRNPLYWQGNIRKRLNAYTERILDKENFFYTHVPEGYGVNVIETLENLGHEIPRQPEEIVWKVNLIARKKNIKEQ